MTSPPSPPNRRGRWIVVTVVVLVLGMGWWLWPRRDARFVGTWRFFDVYDGKESHAGWIVFHANGSVSATLHSAGGDNPSYWRTDGDCIELTDLPNNLPAVLRVAASWIRTTATGNNNPVGYRRWFWMQSVQRDEIRLGDEPGAGHSVTLKRSPE